MKNGEEPSSRLRVSSLAAVRSDGSPRRPCGLPRALLPSSIREPCPFRGPRARPCWRSHAASVDPSRRIRDPLLPPYPPATRCALIQRGPLGLAFVACDPLCNRRATIRPSKCCTKRRLRHRVWFQLTSVAGNRREISSRPETVPDAELESGTVDGPHFDFCEKAAVMCEAEKDVESAAGVGVVVCMGNHQGRSAADVHVQGFF